MPGKKAKAVAGGYAVPASAFEDELPCAAPAAAAGETAAERAERKAAKAARKAAKAAKAAAGGAAEADGDAAPKKRKRNAEEGGAPASPAAETPAAKAAKATPRMSNAEYRAAHEIKVATDCPDVYQTFEDTGFPAPLLAALLATGFLSPTPIQAVAWPLAAAGRDLVAVAKTGSGKTCGYLLPALARLHARGGPAPKPATELQPGGWWKTDAVAPTSCVLAPTRELALQIADEAAKFASAVCANVVCMYGGVPKNDQLRACRDGCDVLVATPGRLCDFLEPPAGRTPPVTVRSVAYLVLDEADRMLDMGFEPQIRKVVALCPQGAARQTLLFTATWPNTVARAAAALTARGAAHVRIGDNGNRLVVNAAISQVVEVLPNDAAKAPRLETLLRDGSVLPKGERCIVFVATKRRCDQIALQLQRARFAVAGAIHGDKDQREREAALAAFRQGDRNVLVATDVAARGLDIPGVALVVVFDFPREVADYVHRVGRTGRAGASGAAYTFLTGADAGVARELVTLLGDSGSAVPPALKAMAATKQKSGGGGGGGNRWRGGRGGGGRGGGRGGRGRGKW